MSEQGDAVVSLSFPQGETRRACLKIKDVKSGAVVEVALSLEQFALLVSGLQERPATVRRASNLDKWGRQIERRSVAVPLSSMQGIDELFVIADRCPEGFQHAHSSKDNRGNFNIQYVRWEQKQEGAAE